MWNLQNCMKLKKETKHRCWLSLFSNVQTKDRTNLEARNIPLWKNPSLSDFINELKNTYIDMTLSHIWTFLPLPIPHADQQPTIPNSFPLPPASFSSMKQYCHNLLTVSDYSQCNQTYPFKKYGRLGSFSVKNPLVTYLTQLAANIVDSGIWSPILLLYLLPILSLVHFASDMLMCLRASSLTVLLHICHDCRSQL